MLCLFVNAFRDDDQRWPRESFTQWVTIQHYLIGSPNTNRIFREFSNLRRTFNKQFTARVTQRLREDLWQMRQEHFTSHDVTYQQVIDRFSINKALKTVVQAIVLSLVTV